MNVSEIMSKHVICVNQDEPVSAAARLLKRHNLGSLPVCDPDGQLRGMITDRDIVLRCIAGESDPNLTKIYEIMSRSVAFATPDESIEQAASKMSSEQVRRLPVVENGVPIGMVSVCDMLRSQRCEAEAAQALSDITANLRRKKFSDEK